MQQDSAPIITSIYLISAGTHNDNDSSVYNYTMRLSFGAFRVWGRFSNADSYNAANTHNTADTNTHDTADTNADPWPDTDARESVFCLRD